MTTTLRTEANRGTVSADGSAAGRWTSPWAFLAIALAEVVGVACVVDGYRIAQGVRTGTAEFAWFWIGMLIIELPIVACIARRSTNGAERRALLTLFGLVTFAPKLLRNPSTPLYHDEFAHWREVYDILNTGKLFQQSPIVPIIARYPGLHAATAAVVRASGLNIWSSAEILLALCHLMLVLGIYCLAQALGLDDRVAALAAVLYSLNSSFLYFDTQFAYESMAITLVVWSLVCFVRATRARASDERIGWSVIALLMIAATVITHHLSAIILVLVLCLGSTLLSIPGIAKAPNWAATAATAWCVTLLGAAMVLSWLVFVAPATLSYLSPYLTQGFAEVAHFLQGRGGNRQLFGASLSPWWEQKSAYLVPVLAVVLAGGGIFTHCRTTKRRRLPSGRRKALLAAFGLFGLLYFPSTIFILSAAGAEGARRSWAFSWIGLSLTMAPAATWLLEWVSRRRQYWRRFALRLSLFAAFAAGLVGGTAAGLDASYRFPGPFLYGSDARSVTPELLGTSRWFDNMEGPGKHIVTDRYTGLVFASFGLQDTASPSAGFPTYDLYLSKPGMAVRPSWLLNELRSSDYKFLVVDERLAYEVPEVGVYFEPDEPRSLITNTGKPLFAGRLGKFNSMSWMIKIYQSNNYSIYRMNLPVDSGYSTRPPERDRGALRVEQ